MKIILIKDLNVNKKGEIVNVKPGYFKNYLWPKGLAVLLNSSEGKEAINAIKLENIKQKSQTEDIKILCNKLNNKTINFILNEGKNGEIFGSVSVVDIANNLEIDKKFIILDKPLKIKGCHKIELKFSPEISGMINIQIDTKKVGKNKSK